MGETKEGSRCVCLDDEFFLSNALHIGGMPGGKVGADLHCSCTSPLSEVSDELPNV